MPVREKRAVLRSLFSPGSKKYWNLKTEHARLLFLVLLTNADDFGRLEGAPEDVKSLIPRSNWTLDEITTYVADLKRCDLIQHFKVEKEWYIEVVNFWENQDRHGVMQVPSKFPESPNGVFHKHQDGVHDSENGVSRKLESPHEDEYHHPHNPPPHGKEESEKETNFDFRQFRKKWKAITGRNAKTTTTNKRLFDQDCAQYGIEDVLRSIEPWANDQNEVFLNGPAADWMFLNTGVHDYAGQKPEKERGQYPDL